MFVTPLYTAHATSTGGRNSRSETRDGVVSVDFSVPKAMGGAGKAGATTPEHLFAAGYAACFGSALRYVGRRYKKDVSASLVTAHVTIGTSEGAGFGLTVTINAHVPGCERAEAEILVEEAHEVCAYSNAIRGNVPVELVVTV